MNIENASRIGAVGRLIVVVGLFAGSASAQTKIHPGFNLFSVEQDREIGRASAEEAERRLPMLTDASTTRFIDAVGRRLAASTQGAEYQYQFKVVNASDINAFALPGGYMYVNRGLIEAATSEGELAGVMAHEMAHVALRHGTNQASKAYLSQTGLALLGGFVDSPSTEKTISSVGGFGLNALFLKFSRADEKQADIVGAQILAKAGYDPMDMVTFFEGLEAMEDRDPSKVEVFFSSHPPMSDRAERVRAEVAQLSVRVTRPEGGFDSVRAELRGMGSAPTMDELRQVPVVSTGSWGAGRDDGSIAELNVPRPSSEYRRFQQSEGNFQIQHPKNWTAHGAVSGYGVTIAPDGGFIRAKSGRPDLIYGVIVNHYAPLDDRFNQYEQQTARSYSRRGRRTSRRGFVDNDDRIRDRTKLVRATDDLVRQLMRSNPDLRIVQGARDATDSEGQPVISVELSGRSPVTRQEESVTLATRELPDGHVVYAVFVVPTRDKDAAQDTFDRMMSSLVVSTRAHL